MITRSYSFLLSKGEGAARPLSLTPSLRQKGKAPLDSQCFSTSQAFIRYKAFFNLLMRGKKKVPAPNK